MTSVQLLKAKIIELRTALRWAVACTHHELAWGGNSSGEESSRRVAIRALLGDTEYEKLTREQVHSTEILSRLRDEINNFDFLDKP